MAVQNTLFVLRLQDKQQSDYYICVSVLSISNSFPLYVRVIAHFSPLGPDWK